MFSDNDEELDPLDLVGENVEELFGSYQMLVQMDTFRFEHPKYSVPKHSMTEDVVAAARPGNSG